jgi:hypothetical protein
MGSSGNFPDCMNSTFDIGMTHAAQSGFWGIHRFDNAGWRAGGMPFAPQVDPVGRPTAG